MTHVENLMRIWKAAANAADEIADQSAAVATVQARARGRAELHREHANALGAALRRDAAELADEPWDYEAESDRAERMAEAKSDHDFERKGDGR